MSSLVHGGEGSVEDAGSVREERGVWIDGGIYGNRGTGKLTEHVHLGEGPNDAELVAKDLGWWPGDAGCLWVDAMKVSLALIREAAKARGKGVCRVVEERDIPINDQRPAPATIIDRVLQDLDRPRRLNDNIESVWVVLFELFKLCGRVRPRQLNVRVGCVKLPREVHLGATGCGDGYLGAAVEPEELG